MELEIVAGRISPESEWEDHGESHSYNDQKRRRKRRVSCELDARGRKTVCNPVVFRRFCRA